MKKYQIYNGFSTSMLKEDPIVEAESGADACRKFLKQIGIEYTHIKRSGSNNVKIKTQPFYEKDGYKYRDGIVSWFEVWNGNIIY